MQQEVWVADSKQPETGYDQIAAAAGRIFATRDGQVLMAYLRQQYYDKKAPSEELERWVGQREVIRRLISMSEVKE